jgi:hypothetical protein
MSEAANGSSRRARGNARGLRPWHVLISLVLIGLAALAIALLTPVTTVSDNAVVDGNAGYFKYDLGGRLTISADQQIRRPVIDPDAFVAIPLVFLAALALATKLLLSAVPGVAGNSFGRFLTVCSVGSAAFAADELCGIHETVGANAVWLSDIPGMDAPDNIFIVLYAVAVAVLAWRYWDVIKQSRVGLAICLAGATLAAVAVAMEVMSYHLEETIEIPAAIVLVLGLSVTIVSQARARLERFSPSASPDWHQRPTRYSATAARMP